MWCEIEKETRLGEVKRHKGAQGVELMSEKRNPLKHILFTNNTVICNIQYLIENINN